MNILHSTLTHIRDKYTPAAQTSTFRNTGQITHEEFVAAGDYLVYKFPTWSWADTNPTTKRDARLPDGKQFLVTRGVPCHQRLDDNFAGDAGHDETMVGDGEDFKQGAAGGTPGDDDDGWLRTGGLAASQEARARDVRTVDESGNMGEREEEDEEIPDMEDDDDDPEAIIKNAQGTEDSSTSLRKYTLYITYSNYYRTPRLYLSGYTSNNTPLSPRLMMEDIVGDYKDKTVTLEDFPYFSNNIKMASVHPCKHASVMKTLLDRADAALKIRREKQRLGLAKSKVDSGMEGLVDDMSAAQLADKSKSGFAEGTKFGGNGNDEWEVLPNEAGEDDNEVAIRCDQFLVVFLKFIATITPTIEHDFTMEV